MYMKTILQILLILLCSSIAYTAITTSLEQQTLSDFSTVYKEYKTQFVKSEYETNAAYTQRLKDFFEKEPVRYFKVSIYKSYDAETQTLSIWDYLGSPSCDGFCSETGTAPALGLFGSLPSFCGCKNWKLQDMACGPGTFGGQTCGVLGFSAGWTDKNNETVWNDFFISNSANFSFSSESEGSHLKVILSRINLPSAQAQQVSNYLNARIGVKVNYSPTPISDASSNSTSGSCSSNCCFCTNTSTYQQLLAELRLFTVYDNQTNTIYAQYYDPTQCTYSITPTSQSFISAVGIGTVNITTSGSSCTWAATNSPSWVTITSGASGTGSGTVNISVATNTTGASRTGNINIAGQTFTVTQSALNNCTATVSSILVVHIPILTYSGINYWADLQYNSSNATLTVVSGGVGVVSDASSYNSCTTSTLSSGGLLHIPDVFYNDISYWIDLQWNGSAFTTAGSGKN